MNRAQPGLALCACVFRCFDNHAPGYTCTLKIILSPSSQPDIPCVPDRRLAGGRARGAGSLAGALELVIRRSALRMISACGATHDLT